eukprot:9795133-Heterocapsa_arctica.AAC.1
MEATLMDGSRQDPPLSNEDIYKYMMIEQPNLFDRLIQAPGEGVGDLPAQGDNPACAGYHAPE